VNRCPLHVQGKRWVEQSRHDEAIDQEYPYLLQSGSVVSTG
jgi:hypothetical protein